ncbi:putative translation initiation factor eIF-2B subunit epsilon [Phytophthora citrophthora]|uniref:Translation initiation factor eIF2B subunit epsilon n=1 Tax=Phytophthora citrophthora TaxID=4793 RepID=A0AAD9LDG6_9STRA|nr:putative translation initiation factor eIF-2B subunit epsilon [Phytophthora citrophthora]
MPRRRPTPASASDDTRREAPLQAVLFADSFTETFRPITLDLPKVLLPLANVPMLEYSLEFLAASGVQEVLLFCTGHAEQIESFIENESQVAQRLDVTCVSSPSCLTAGDALREIDRRQLVQSNPFVLMSGDVVANVDLQEAIAEHKSRKKADPNCIMTSIFKELRPNFATSVRPLDDELIVGVDAATSQLVLYEDNPEQRSTRLATLFLEDHAQIALRSDLLDCYIDVCSPEVLLKFAEDFDYQDLRRDFLHNEVQNYELGKKFFVKVVTDEFAARVMDPRTYAGVSQAILQRWVFPMVPDANYLGAGEVTHYEYLRGMRYKDANVSLARSCDIQRECILGAGTTIAEHTCVRKSAIGKNCVIGENVKIDGSFLWSNVVVEDGAVVTNAILCDNVVVKRGAVIGEGCVLSFGVVIGEGFKLPPFTKVTTSLAQVEDDGFFSDEEEASAKKEDLSDGKAPAQWNSKDVGVGGVGRVWTLDEDDIEVDSDSEGEDDEDEQAEAKKQARRIEKLKSTLIGANDVIAKKMRRWEEWETLSSSEEEDENEDDLLAEANATAIEVPFQQIIRENVCTGDAAGHNVDDLFMEIKSFKFAQNRSFAEVIGAIIPGLLDLIPTGNGQSAMTILGNVRTKFQKWSSVIQRCLVEQEDQLAIVDALEGYCAEPAERRALWLPLFRFLLQTVYDLEWVSEDVILEWHEAQTASAEDEETLDALAAASKTDVQEFIEWLQESDDEDDDDDSDEDSDDD